MPGRWGARMAARTDFVLTTRAPGRTRHQPPRYISRSMAAPVHPADPLDDAYRPAALVPADRCESSVGAVVRGLLSSVEHVLVVHDGSENGTSDAAREAGARVLRRRENGGKGSAVRDGLGK